MERAAFLEHYRISNEYDGSAIELARTGSAFTYKAADLRSGAPVALTLLPIASVDTAARERFEEQARASEQLDHINIARIFAFGIVEDQFAFVSEYPQGETVESWIAAHGPMPPDAVLRVALQVVSALSAGSFYGLTHPAIQPSNLMIVAGKTAEGGWPCVQLMNFGLAGLKLALAEPGKHAMVSEFASPEQLQQGTTDFRSEIYSLGATMCFILTGAFYSAEPRSVQTRRFARPLRNLIAPMLRQNPDERPQDPVLVAQALRSCLQRVERRQALAQRFGIPFVAVKARRAKPRPHPVPVPLEADVVSGPAPIAAPVPGAAPIPVTGRPRSWLLRRAVAVAALLLVLATAAALLLPAPVSMILHRNRDKAAIGVPVGIPESSAMAMAQNNSSATAPVAAAPPVQSPPSNVPSPSSSVPIENKVVANASQTVSPAQTTGQLAPASSPAEANRNENAVAVADQPVAQTSPVVNQPIASAQQNAPTFTQETQSGGAEASPSTSRSIVAADAATPPAAPAEGPQTVWEREAGAKEKFATGKANDEGDAASASAPEQRGENATGKSSTASSKSRSKPKEVASNTRRRSGTTRYDRSRTLQASPDQEDRYQPPYQPYSEDQRPRPRRALPGGSFRARVVGTTPEGDLILRLPSGEIAIVPPRHRPRRILVERPGIPMPPPQYLPAYPSGD